MILCPVPHPGLGGSSAALVHACPGLLVWSGHVPRDAGGLMQAVLCKTQRCSRRSTSALSLWERLQVTMVRICPRSEELLVRTGQSLAHLKPKGRESGGSELLIRQQVHISRRLKLLPLSRCSQVPKFLSEDNVHPCAKGHIHPVGSTAACSILPRSLPSCPLLLLGFLQVAFAAITPVRALPVGLAHARDPLHSTQHFWRALQNAYRLQKRVEKPSKQNTALASAPQDRVAAPCQAGWGKPARPSRLHFAAVPCAAGRTPEAQARC